VAFASAQAKAVHVTFAGGATGSVTGALECTRSCTGWFEPGTAAALRARTPSTFGGWSGACSGTSKTCDLGAIVNDRDLTAMFVPDARALQTVVDRSSVRFTAAAFASDGDLIVGVEQPVSGGSRLVSRRAPDGAVRWSTAIGLGAPAAIAVDYAGAIYALGDLDPAGALVKLSAAGQELWRRSIAAPDLGADGLAVLADGRVAVIGSEEVRVFGGDGSMSWSAALPPCVASAVAASPSSVVVVACTSGELQRFDTTGKPLTAWALPDAAGHVHTVSLAFDPLGSLFVHATRTAGAEGSRLVTRLDLTGAPAFTVTDPVPVINLFATYQVPRPRIRVSSSGMAFTYLPHRLLIPGRLLSPIEGGALIQTFTASGTASWSLDKPHSGVGLTDPAWDSVSARDAACDAAAHCALVGTYGVHDQGGWIETFSVPAG
jgi:hypothetical protein